MLSKTEANIFEYSQDELKEAEEHIFRAFHPLTFVPGKVSATCGDLLDAVEKLRMHLSLSLTQSQQRRRPAKRRRK